MQPTPHDTRPSHARPSRPLPALAATLAIVLALAASACADVTTAPAAAARPSASLGLPDYATADTLAVGGTVQLTSTLRTGSRSGTPAWHSSHPHTATVSQAGLVTAVAPGSATISVSNGASSDSVTIVVVARAAAPSAPPLDGAAAVLAFMGASNVPTASALQAKGGVYARYESDFAAFADRQWAADSTSFSANFYDRAMVYYVGWARTGNATYLDRANKLAIGARTYLESVNYYPQAYQMMLDGVALHALVTGDQRSATAVARVADSMANPNGYWSYVAGAPGEHDGDSRTSARVLSAVLDAYLLKVPSPSGYDYAARLADLESRILTTQSADGAYRWPSQCGFNKPFMTGMVNEALIRYYTTFRADPRIVPAVKQAVDYMWNVDWVPALLQFKYLDADCAAADEVSGPNADLNNLISSGFAFVARQTGNASYYLKGDAVFAGGVYGAWLYGSKEFTQEYTASYRFLSLRF